MAIVKRKELKKNSFKILYIMKRHGFITEKYKPYEEYDEFIEFYKEEYEKDGGIIEYRQYTKDEVNIDEWGSWGVKSEVAHNEMMSEYEKNKI
jgi:hypothetical protein